MGGTRRRGADRGDSPMTSSAAPAPDAGHQSRTATPAPTPALPSAPAAPSADQAVTVDVASPSRTSTASTRARSRRGASRRFRSPRPGWLCRRRRSSRRRSSPGRIKSQVASRLTDVAAVVHASGADQGRPERGTPGEVPRSMTAAVGRPLADPEDREALHVRGVRRGGAGVQRHFLEHRRSPSTSGTTTPPGTTSTSRTRPTATVRRGGATRSRTTAGSFSSPRRARGTARWCPAAGRPPDALDSATYISAGQQNSCLFPDSLPVLNYYATPGSPTEMVAEHIADAQYHPETTYPLPRLRPARRTHPPSGSPAPC